MIDPNAGSNTGDAYRPVSGKGLSTLAQWFGDGEDERVDGPVCDWHPEALTQLFCPCRAPLLPRSHFVRNEPVGLGIAGPRSAGKTVLLLAMMHELRRRGLQERNLGLTGLGDTEIRFGEMSRRLFKGGEKPRGTATEVPDDLYDPDRLPDPETVPQSFAWQLSDSVERRRPPRLLAVYDLAGETWGLGSTEGLGRLDRYLSLLSSMIFVVDGAAVAHDLGWEGTDAWDQSAGERWDDGATDRQWLSTLIDRMGDRTRQSDLAMVITKADLLWRQPEWSALKPKENQSSSRDSQEGADPEAEKSAEDLLEDLLERSHRRDLIHSARRNFRNLRLFATSSLGFSPTAEDIVDHRLRRPLQPLGALDALEWLLSTHLPKGRGQ